MTRTQWREPMHSDTYKVRQWLEIPVYEFNREIGTMHLTFDCRYCWLLYDQYENGNEKVEIWKLCTQSDCN